MKQNEIFSYVADFASQLMDRVEIFNSLDHIILFGSAARGDFTKESDIDLFVDIKSAVRQKKVAELVKKELNKFELRAEKNWHLRGVDLPLKIIVGKLEQEKWKELREEILSYGKVLYGKYERLPEKLSHHIFISYQLKSLSQPKKMAFLRKLFGYNIRKDGKEYPQTGLLRKINGEKTGPNTVLVGAENFSPVKKLLKEYAVPYLLRDMWMK